MATVRALQLAASIERDGLRPIYGLVGAADPLVSASLSLLKGAVERPELPGSVTTDLEHAPEPREVFDELRTPPFMGMKGLRLVIVRRGEEFLSHWREVLERYLEAPSATGILALCCARLDRRTAIAKRIERCGVTVDCAALKWAEAENWVRQRARLEGKTLTPAASSALVQAVGANLTALGNELAKLVLYVSESDTVSQRDVEQLVPASRTRSIFDLSEAVLSGASADALRLAHQFLLGGHRPEEIVAFLGGQIRRLWQVKRMVAAGASQGEVQKALNMRDFAVRKSVGLVRRLTDDSLAHRLRILAAADREAKTTSVRAREQSVWVEALVAELCLQGSAGTADPSR